MYKIVGPKLSQCHKYLILCEIIRHMTIFLVFWVKLPFWPQNWWIIMNVNRFIKLPWTLYSWNKCEKCFQMIYNILCFVINSTKIVPKPIGRFFPDLITQPRDSKMKKKSTVGTRYFNKPYLGRKSESFPRSCREKICLVEFEPMEIFVTYQVCFEESADGTPKVFLIKKESINSFLKNQPIMRKYVFSDSEKPFIMLNWWRHRYDSSILTSKSWLLNPILVDNC